MKRVIKIVAIVSVIAIGIGGAVMVFAGPNFNMIGAGKGWFGGMGRGRHGFMGHGMPDEKMLMSRLKEQLNLTEEQEAQILPILKDHMEKQRATFEKYKGQAKQSLETIQKEQQEKWQELESQLTGILTEEQMQEFRKMHEERQQFAQGMFRTHGEFRQLIEDLNITAAQKTELFAIFIKYRENHMNTMDSFLEIRSQFSNLILNEEFDEEKVRQTFRQSTAKLEDSVVSGAKMLTEMKAVLTPEQVELLQNKIPELLDKTEEQMKARRAMFGKWFPHHE